MKRNDANELYMYIRVCIGVVGVCKREREGEREKFCAPSRIPRWKLCVALLRSRATKTHGGGQEISQTCYSRKMMLLTHSVY